MLTKEHFNFMPFASECGGWLTYYRPHLVSGPDISQWCVEVFGEAGPRWAMGMASMYLRDADDVTVFLLRWG